MASDGPEYEYSGSEEEEEEEVAEDEGEPRYSLSGGGSVHCLLGVCTTVTELCPPPPSSIVNVPGEWTLRREFLRLQTEDSEGSRDGCQDRSSGHQRQQVGPGTRDHGLRNIT